MLGQHVFVMGDDAGASSLMKLAGNTLAAMTLQRIGALWRLGGTPIPIPPRPPWQATRIERGCHSHAGLADAADYARVASVLAPSSQG
jgi:hypothetical protein